MVWGEVPFVALLINISEVMEEGNISIPPSLSLSLPRKWEPHSREGVSQHRARNHTLMEEDCALMHCGKRAEECYPRTNDGKASLSSISHSPLLSTLRPPRPSHFPHYIPKTIAPFSVRRPI